MIETPVTETRTTTYLSSYGGPKLMRDGNNAPLTDGNGLFLYAVDEFLRNPSDPNDAFVRPLVLKSDGSLWDAKDMSKQVLGTADTLEMMDAVSKMDAATARVAAKVSANFAALADGKTAAIDNASAPVAP